MKQNIILACAPKQVSQAQKFGTSLAQIAYQIASDGSLCSIKAEADTVGQMMFLSDAGEMNFLGKNPLALCQSIINECKTKGFSAVILGILIEHPFFHALAAELSKRLKTEHINLYLPERYAKNSTWANVMIPTALSAGSLEQVLQKSGAKYGFERMLLDIERMRIDISMQNTAREKLSAQRLYQIQQIHKPKSYFSEDLQAYYFSYEDPSGAHFVLYDDSYSIERKLRIAEQFGIQEAMFLYTEVEDILNKIIKIE